MYVISNVNRFTIVLQVCRRIPTHYGTMPVLLLPQPHKSVHPSPASNQRTTRPYPINEVRESSGLYTIKSYAFSL